MRASLGFERCRTRNATNPLASMSSGGDALVRMRMGGRSGQRSRFLWRPEPEHGFAAGSCPLHTLNIPCGVTRDCTIRPTGNDRTTTPREKGVANQSPRSATSLDVSTGGWSSAIIRRNSACSHEPSLILRASSPVMASEIAIAAATMAARTTAARTTAARTTVLSLRFRLGSSWGGNRSGSGRSCAVLNLVRRGGGRLLQTGPGLRVRCARVAVGIFDESAQPPTSPVCHLPPL